MLNYSVVKKYIFISAITMLFIFLGSGLQSVLAGNDIGTMMKNWFAKEQSQSVDEVYAAISVEKEILLAELQQAIDEEKQRALQELEQFKQQEIAIRISSLRSYAATLAEGITIDTSAEKASIMAELDAIFANAVSQMGGASSPTHSPPLTGEIPKKEDNVAEGEEASNENNIDEDANDEVEELDEDFNDVTKPDSGANDDSDIEQSEQEDPVDADFSAEDDSPSDDSEDRDEGQDAEVIIEPGNE